MTHRRDDDPIDDFSSPACSMHEADDVYMGYASKEELAQFLNELLEAMRATAQVARESAAAAGSASIAEILQTLQRDEARCCALLIAHLKTRAEAVSWKIGACYGQAMAIADVGERIALLNRYQREFAQQLRVMLPRVRDQRLHADLTEMLRLHEANIVLGTRPHAR